MRVRGNGFTLIELMVTIAVLAIVAMMAAPSFASYMANNKVSNVASDLDIALNEARSQAIIKNNPYFVCLVKNKTGTTITEAGCINYLNSSANTSSVIAQKRVKLVELPFNVKVNSDEYGVMFNSNGTVSTPPTINICYEGKSAKIAVSFIGAENIEKGIC